MIQAGTSLKIVDNSGVVKVKCIKVFGNRKHAFINDKILVVIMKYNTKRGFLRDPKKRARYLAGTLHIVLIIRTKFQFRRWNGIYVRFNENAVIFISDNNVPLAKRVKGPVLIETGQISPSTLSVCQEII